MKYLLSILSLSFLLSACASSESSASKSQFDFPEGCEEPRTPPKVTNMREAMNAHHEYPADLRSRNIEGRVTLKLLISDTGAVETLSIEQSPHHELTKVTQNVANNLIIEPGTCSGAPTEMPIDFSLNYFVDRSY